ncbi:MAG: acyl-CoA reductase [Phycisphaerae bacterium]|nr:acyl-CoA reductase [Phycisphaerae bacterium]
MTSPLRTKPRDIAAGAQRVAARARPIASASEALDIADLLAEVAHRWLEPADPIRRRALDKLETFSRQMWADAIDAMFSPITRGSLRTFVETELADISLRPPRVIGHVLARNAPAPAVQSIFCGLLTGSGQIVKAPLYDRRFAGLLVDSIAAVSPRLRKRMRILCWLGSLEELNAALAVACDTIVAFGHGETMESWRRIIASANPACQLVAHGPRTSVEIVELAGETNRWTELAERIAFDVAMYEQQGCLSPQQVFLCCEEASDGHDVSRCRGFAAVLGDALEAKARRWRPPERSIWSLTAIRRAREAHRMGRIADPSHGPWLPDELCGPANRFDWTLLSTLGPSPQLGPGGRTVFLTRVASAAAAVEAIEPLAPFIQGVAVEARDATVAQILRDRLHIPYVCKPGELQRPPFGWRNDGVPPLRSLCEQSCKKTGPRFREPGGDELNSCRAGHFGPTGGGGPIGAPVAGSNRIGPGGSAAPPTPAGPGPAPAGFFGVLGVTPAKLM